MFRSDDVIDFEPARITSIDTNENYISVKLPCQPCYSQVNDPLVDTIPNYSCEMQVLSGKIDLLKVSLPFETEYWEIEHDKGVNACFLPHNFNVSGLVRLVFYINSSGDPAIVINGNGFLLNVLNKC